MATTNTTRIRLPVEVGVAVPSDAKDGRTLTRVRVAAGTAATTSSQSPIG